jgi:phospholipid/cholesterol/gamma-HCH transport system ATP-binding protein
MQGPRDGTGDVDPSSAGSADGGICLRGASFRYVRSNVLSNAVFDLPRGGSCVVTGANGSGKSTFLYITAGLLPLERGSITIGGQHPNPTRPSDLMRRGVRRGFVFQEGGLVSNMNGLANVALALRYHADLFGLTDAEVEQRARNALARVRVSDTQMLELPAHLSFGVRKRVALARAMAIEPNFFYFDEPDVGLDPNTAALVHEILCEYRDDPSVTMLIATNRDALVERLEVPGFVLSDGALVERTGQGGAPRRITS